MISAATRGSSTTIRRLDVPGSEPAERPGNRGNAERCIGRGVLPSPFPDTVHLRGEAGNNGTLASARGIQNGLNAAKTNFIITFPKTAPSVPPHAVPSLGEYKVTPGAGPTRAA